MNGVASEHAAELARARAELAEILESKELARLRPEHAVARYALAHEKAYGVDAVELVADWPRVVAAAQQLVATLAGDVGAVVDLPWWRLGQEARAIAAGKGSDRPLGWRIVFSPSTASAYRAARVRRGLGADVFIVDDDESAAPIELRSPAECIRATIGRPITRLATGLESLDAMTGGGLRTGQVVVVGGAPGAGKTTLLVQLAETFARSNVPTLLVAVDEDREAAAYRIGQRSGLALASLEDDTDDARAELADELERIPDLHMVDTYEDGVELLAAIECLVRVADGRPAALLVDSLQAARVPTLDGDDDRDPRARIDRVLGLLKSFARQHDLLVIVTSELARGSYRSRDARERTDDLASAKESGAIEYAAGALLVLRSVAASPDRVDVTIPKLRRGRPRPFRLRLDRATATFAEVPMDESALDADLARERPTEPALDATKRRILELVRTSATPLASKTAITRVRGIGRKCDVFAAADELLREGVIVMREGKIVVVDPSSSQFREPVPGTTHSALVPVVPLPLRGNHLPEPVPAAADRAARTTSPGADVVPIRRRPGATS